MKTLALLLIFLVTGSGCVTQPFHKTMPKNYYQYQVSDHPMNLFDDGIQVVPLVEDNGCRRMRVPGSESWQGSRWQTVCR